MKIKTSSLNVLVYQFINLCDYISIIIVTYPNGISKILIFQIFKYIFKVNIIIILIKKIICFALKNRVIIKVLN